MRRQSRTPARVRGFSLIEIMIVIVLIGGIMALVTNKVMNSQAQANVKLVAVQMTTLTGKIDQFRSEDRKSVV